MDGHTLLFLFFATAVACQSIGMHVLKNNIGMMRKNYLLKMENCLVEKKLPEEVAVQHASIQASVASQENVKLQLKVDFYCEKLRDIETLCLAPELQAIPAIRIVEKILYAADSAEAKDAMAKAQQVYGATFEQPATGCGSSCGRGGCH